MVGGQEIMRLMTLQTTAKMRRRSRRPRKQPRKLPKRGQPTNGEQAGELGGQEGLWVRESLWWSHGSGNSNTTQVRAPRPPGGAPVLGPCHACGEFGHLKYSCKKGPRSPYPFSPDGVNGD